MGRYAQLDIYEEFKQLDDTDILKSTLTPPNKKTKEWKENWEEKQKIAVVSNKNFWSPQKMKN